MIFLGCKLIQMGADTNQQNDPADCLEWTIDKFISYHQ
jgi:hypothetical protein